MKNLKLTTILVAIIFVTPLFSQEKIHYKEYENSVTGETFPIKIETKENMENRLYIYADGIHTKEEDGRASKNGGFYITDRNIRILKTYFIEAKARLIKLQRDIDTDSGETKDGFFPMIYKVYMFYDNFGFVKDPSSFLHFNVFNADGKATLVIQSETIKQFKKDVEYWIILDDLEEIDKLINLLDSDKINEHLKKNKL